MPNLKRIETYYQDYSGEKSRLVKLEREFVINTDYIMTINTYADGFYRVVLSVENYNNYIIIDEQSFNKIMED